jgi:hypothetical protein
LVTNFSDGLISGGARVSGQVTKSGSVFGGATVNSSSGLISIFSGGSYSYGSASGRNQIYGVCTGNMFEEICDIEGNKTPIDVE